MQFGVPIYQKSWSRLYDPLRGRDVLGEHKGFFKKAGRLFYNDPIRARHDGHAVLAEFIDRYDGLEKKDIHFVRSNGKNFIGMGKGPFDLFRCYKYRNSYYIQTYNQYFKDSKIPLKINARNIDQLKDKLHAIFNTPVGRSKLELKTPKVPLVHFQHISPGGGRYVFLNDVKMISNRYPQAFDTSNIYVMANEFDTALGGVAAGQVNHHMSDDERGRYSAKPYDQNFITVQDDAWMRLHAMSEHLLSSNISKNIIGNIINMHGAKTDLSNKKFDYLTQELLQDYIYNIHGKGTSNTRKRGESPTLNNYNVKDKNILNQFLFGANPFRGGRVFRDLPLSLEQTILAFYAPRADGTRVCKYDIDPQKFATEMKKLCITPVDRQFMAAHSRKILGAYVVLRLFQDEITNIELDPQKISSQQLAYNRQKWAALNKSQDMIFESTGDMRDILRLSVASYAQLRDSVKKSMPPLIENENMHEITAASKNKQAFSAYTTDKLLNHIQEYTYTENLFGWHARERIGSMIYAELANNLFEKEIPKVRASTAAIILLEGIESLSRELKYIDNALEKTADASGVLQSFFNKVKYGDIQGVKEMAEWNKKRLFHGFKDNELYPNFKRQALQAEGVIMEDDYFPPETRKYFGENQGFFFGNAPTNRVGFQYGKQLGKIFADSMRLYAVLIQRIRSEMRQKNISDPYKTQAMSHLEDMLRGTAQHMTDQHVKFRSSLYKGLKPDDLDNMKRELHKKFYHYLQVNVNVAALLANAPDVVHRYG